MRVRRSKAELYLEKLVREEFGEHFEVVGDDKVSFRGNQLDISLPELRIAVEWWGPFHYRPGVENQDFELTRSRDKRKKLRIEKAGWKLIVVGCSEQESPSRGFVEEKFRKYVRSEIEKVIDEKIPGKLQVKGRVGSGGGF